MLVGFSLQVMSAIYRCTNGQQNGTAIDGHCTIARWRTALALTSASTARLGVNKGSGTGYQKKHKDEFYFVAHVVVHIG